MDGDGSHALMSWTLGLVILAWCVADVDDTDGVILELSLGGARQFCNVSWVPAKLLLCSHAIRLLVRVWMLLLSSSTQKGLEFTQCKAGRSEEATKTRIHCK